MARLLTAFLSLHWTMVFAVAASHYFVAQPETAVGGLAALPGLAGSGPLVFCIGNALIAVLFLWLLVSAMLERGPENKETGEVARIVFGGGVLMTTAGLLADTVLPSAQAVMSGAVQLAALMASYLVIHFDRLSAPRATSAGETDSGGVARAMALGAVHDSIVARLATPASRDERGG